MSNANKHHLVWLEAHPCRDSAWLCFMIKNGMDIHHIDGNHDNNDSSNLILIEAQDHMMLHNGKRSLRNARECQRKGIEKAKELGTYKGRKAALTPNDLTLIRERLNSGITVTSLAKEFRVTRQTIYRSIEREVF